MSAETNAPKSRIERLRELLAEAKVEKAQQLPKQTVNGLLCFRDDRLREWRPVNDPLHPIPYGTAHPDKCLKCHRRETCDHKHEGWANCDLVPGAVAFAAADPSSTQKTMVHLAILNTGLLGLLTMLVKRLVERAEARMTPHTWSKKRSLWLRITEPDRTSGCLYHLRELAARLVVVLIFAVYLSLTVCVALLIWRLLSALGL